MDPVLARIDAWQQAGLLDPVTAARLRADEAGRTADAGRTAGAGPASTADPSASLAQPSGQRRERKGVSAADVLGPAPPVPEMFAYLGVGFLLAAWTAFVARLEGDGSLAVVGGGLLIAAVVLASVGLVLRAGDDRRRRGAGMAFLGAILYSVGAAAGFLSSLNVSGSAEYVILAIIGLVVAAAVRFIHAGLLTQFGLIASITALAGAVLTWLRDVVTPNTFTDEGQPIGPTPDPLVLILVGAATWLLVALGLGLLALREANASRDSAAAPGAPGRRATLTRIWAGTIAVGGLASALSTSDQLANGDYGRVVAPWIMDAALLVLAAILVERAFRRHAGAFLFAAGIALIIALTDFNFSYLSSSPELGLLTEGALLLGVGFGADRLRRRLPGGPPDPAPADPLARYASREVEPGME
jgi:hypothetical protein